jgi:DNA-binding transcriptional ArsR family regulator
MVYRRQRLDSTFAALADPTRRTILALLAERERTISELAGRFTMSLPAVSKHVRVLERAGLARVRREGRVRRCVLRPAPMREAAAWIARYREYWESSFDRLSAYLEAQLREEAGEWPRKQDAPSSSSSGGPSMLRRSASSGRGRKRKR